MIEEIVTLVVDEARKMSGFTMDEALFLVWNEVAAIISPMEVKIEAINDSQMSDREKRQAIDLILTSHKT